MTVFALYKNPARLNIHICIFVHFIRSGVIRKAKSLFHGIFCKGRSQTLDGMADTVNSLRGPKLYKQTKDHQN